ncbi:MAG: hypothetical protein CSA84_05875 [Actinomycetales bacterium]|nr:MAG: hypothetical protein CSA84_05875 [Actinomycetales bacterium]
MALSQAWVIPWALAAAAVVMLVVALVLRRRRSSRPSVLLANTETVTQLPEYTHALWLHRLRTAGYAAVAAVVIITAVLAAARPVTRTIVNPEKANRDIVLCLDISGSMWRANQEVLKAFRRMVEGFRGERIALVVFNSTAVPLFPLTDDYDVVDEQLREAERALRRRVLRYFAGTFNGPGSSLIGDGLATCLRSFDQPERVRARSVILATDNHPEGTPIFTLEDGGELAMQLGVQVYGLNPEFEPTVAEVVGMRSLCEDTGGLYYSLDSSTAVRDIVAAVNAREAGRIVGAPVTLVHDAPRSLIGWLGVGVLAVLATVRRWRR